MFVFSQGIRKNIVLFKNNIFWQLFKQLRFKQNGNIHFYNQYYILKRMTYKNFGQIVFGTHAPLHPRLYVEQ